tara:strand:- start:392 stop:637 length:246 start_codon:yes stop_codon:yes gene_type:complete
MRNLNIVSTVYTGNTTIPRNINRGYFMITMTSGTCTLNFGGGTGELPVAAAGYYEPLIAPNSEIIITTTGTFVVLANAEGV